MIPTDVNLDSKTKAAGVPRSEAHGQEPPVWHARDLFQGRREIVIHHDGQKYRLRITQQNKLILTK